MSEAAELQAVILGWQRKADVTALGELHRVSLAHDILCADFGKRTPVDDDLREELEQLIMEHWTCFDTNEPGQNECPAASPCPACKTRARALAVFSATVDAEGGPTS